MAEEGALPDDGRSSRERGRGFRWSLQRSIDPRLHVAAEAPRRLREDLHQVIQRLGPLMERSQSMSLSDLLRNHRPDGRRSVEENEPARTPHEPPDVARNRHEFVITVDPSRDGETHPDDRQDRQDRPDRPGTTSNDDDDLPSGTAEAGADLQQTDVLRNSPELRTIIAVAEKYLPFFLILLAKLVLDHKTGILVLVGLVVTFTHANAVIKREVGKQNKRNLGCLLAVTINLLTCIVFIYYVFETDKLYYSLVCMLPEKAESLTFWHLFWIVGVTDFVLKLITILVKAVIIVLPAQLVPYQKKGKYYLFIEQTSQLYRSFAPIQPWLWYLLEAYEGFSKVFGFFLSGIYIVSKGKDLLKKGRSWFNSLSKLMQSVSYGKKPSKEQIEKLGGNVCPICQDDFRHPTMLQCKHIFCEECVVMWFDRERTCPMCRAQIADDPTWRDGSTSFFFQLF